MSDYNSDFGYIALSTVEPGDHQQNYSDQEPLTSYHIKADRALISDSFRFDARSSNTLVRPREQMEAYSGKGIRSKHASWFPRDKATDCFKVSSPLEAQLQLLKQERGQTLKRTNASRTTLGCRSNGGTDNTTNHKIIAAEVLEEWDVR